MRFNVWNSHVGSVHPDRFLGVDMKGKIKASSANDFKGTTTTLHLAPEILSKVFYETLQPFDSVDHRVNPANNALQLLDLTHVSSYFRQVAVSDGSLWAEVLYLNGVHADFFVAILERSRGYFISLCFMEDSSLLFDPCVWTRLLLNFNKVRRLQIGVGDSSGGATLKFILSFEAPFLEDLTIQWCGDRNACLDYFEGRILRQPFMNGAPRLRKLHLINCFFPSKHYSAFPNLANLSVMYIGDDDNHDHPPLISILDLSEGLGRFNSLTTLTLSTGCIDPGDFESDIQQAPVHFPRLLRFNFMTTTAACRQLASILRLPAGCSRNIHLSFPPPPHPGVGVLDATSAAEAAALFVPSDVEFKRCVVGMADDDEPFLRLIALGPSTPRIAVEMSFKLSDVAIHSLHPQNQLPTIHYFPGISTRTFTVTDIFLHQLCTTLSIILRKRLSVVSTLYVWFGCESPAVFIAVSLLRSMTNIHEIVSHASDLWANPSIQEFLSWDNAPSLRTLIIPIDETVQSARVLAGISAILRSRSDIGGVIFRVRSATIAEMGYAAPDELRSLIRGISEGFPDTVSLDWVEYQ
ncbi:hypothetical protein DFP72DRAFT_495660 [Ephemerocybe angulata]|uniref:F-box domain-containing protein n=1 Tax=Ephemerocybe angulata TaxID=980116 RepID=A0A8H6HT20_9AGAR|nr:hypothetical protein DFP72DRAFT_495660 [Tulosesus angulatus]